MAIPAHTTLSVQQFLTKMALPTHALPFLFTPSHPKLLFFVSPNEKNVLKSSGVLEDMKQKMAEALKDIKIHEF